MVFIASCGQPPLKIQNFFMSLSEIVESNFCCMNAYPLDEDVGVSNGPSRAGDPIKLGPRPGSGRAYRPVDQSTGRAGPKFIFFKARGQPTSFIMGGPDVPKWRAGWAQSGGPDRPRVAGPTGPEWRARRAQSGLPDGPRVEGPAGLEWRAPLPPPHPYMWPPLPLPFPQRSYDRWFPSPPLATVM